MKRGKLSDSQIFNMLDEPNTGTYDLYEPITDRYISRHKQRNHLRLL